LVTIWSNFLNKDERTVFVNLAGNTYNLADTSTFDGVFQTVVAINRAACDVVNNVRPGNSKRYDPTNQDPIPWLPDYPGQIERLKTDWPLAYSMSRPASTFSFTLSWVAPQSLTTNPGIKVRISIERGRAKTTKTDP